MVDRYTKAVLTVIAAALVTIVVQNSISSSAAQSNVPKVQVCDAWGNCASVIRSKKGFVSLNVTPTTPY